VRHAAVVSPCARPWSFVWALRPLTAELLAAYIIRELMPAPDSKAVPSMR